MDKALQFAKTEKDLIEKINQIVNDEKNPIVIRDAFADWLSWFKTARLPHLNDLDEEKPFYYRAFTIPNDMFCAVQIWEKHQTENLIRCVKTLYANKPSIQYWSENIVDRRKLA